EISVKLRRHPWRGRGIPTADDDATWDRLPRAGGGRPPPEAGDHSRAPRAGEVFVALALNDAEIAVVAERLHSTRGAVYKLLHDARRKLRACLERDGHLEAEPT